MKRINKPYSIVVIILLFSINIIGQVTPSIHILSVGANGNEKLSTGDIESKLEDFNEVITETFRLKQKSNSMYPVSTDTDKKTNRKLSEHFLKADSSDIVIMGIWGAWEKGENDFEGEMITSTDNNINSSVICNFIEYSATETSIFFVVSPVKFPFQVSQSFSHLKDTTAGKILFTFESGNDKNVESIVSDLIDTLDDCANNEDSDKDGDKNILVSEWLSFFIAELRENQIDHNVYKISDGPDYAISLLE